MDDSESENSGMRHVERVKRKFGNGRENKGQLNANARGVDEVIACDSHPLHFKVSSES